MLDSQVEYLKSSESTPDLLYTYDLRGRITDVNRTFEVLTGYSRAEALRMNVLELVAPEHREAVSESMLAAAGGATAASLDVELATRGGGILRVILSTELVFQHGRPIGIRGFARNLIQHKSDKDAQARTEVELIEKTSQLAQFTHHLQLLHHLSTTTYDRIDSLFAEYLRAGCEIFSLDHGLILECVNGDMRVRQSCGPGPHGPEYAPERSAVQLRSTRESPAGNAYHLAAPIVLNEEVYGTISFWSANAGTRPHPHAREIIELMARGIGSAVQQSQLADQLAYQARHDALTGLPNRLMLTERLTSALQRAQNNRATLAVAFIDLDMFKQINDTLGHAIGDAVLQQIGSRLARCIGRGDTLARMGGDEFTAILTEVSSPQEAVAYARKLLTALRTPCRVHDYELFVTASIGISMFPADGSDVDTLLRNADAAMYSAKSRGKNDVHCYQAEVTVTAMQRLELETHLRRALDRNELRMLFQPQVNSRCELEAVEVLLQWEHPELGRIPPAQFIPIAEETGMILTIGAWVLRNASCVMAEWQRSTGHAIPVAVNVSALQFAQGNFVHVIADVLAESGLPAKCLELELTESVLMRDVEQSTAIMEELRSLGVRIAIDDFGTGYSSLSYLRRLPADVLKIDQSFLSSMDNEQSTFALIHAVAVLGHAFGLTVTAEGVETEQQLDLVRRAGCDRVQGHLLGEPLNAQRMEQVLRRPSTLPRSATRQARD